MTMHMKKMIFLAVLTLLSAFVFTACFHTTDPEFVITLSKEDMVGTWRVSSSPIPYFNITFTDKDNFYTYNSEYENQKGKYAFEDDQLVFYFEENGKTAREAYSYKFIDAALTLFDGRTAVMTLRSEDESVFFGNWMEQEDSVYGFYPGGTVLHFCPDAHDPGRMIVDNMFAFTIDDSSKRFKFQDEEYTLSYDGGEVMTLTPVSGVNPRTFTRP